MRHLAKYDERLGEEWMNLPTNITLNNGVEMPILGLGTYLIKPEETRKVVLDALSMGYRHIDTAAFYNNEAAVGEAVRDSGLRREEVFITSKVWNTDHGYKEARAAFERSLQRLGLDYVDLYLIHWPMPKRLETWKALEAIYEEGLVRAIGVSNFVPRHLDELLATGSIIPAVDQIEMHPFLARKDVLEYCKENNISVEAFSPLARGRHLDHPVLVKIAKRNGRTPAQVMIRWCLQKGATAIPKSVHPVRMRENLRALDFSLSPEDVAALDNLDRNARTTTWDPYTFI